MVYLVPGKGGIPERVQREGGRAAGTYVLNGLVSHMSGPSLQGQVLTLGVLGEDYAHY